MKIAYWSPLSPMSTGISDYSEELLPYLAKRDLDIHLIVEDYEPSEKNITDLFPWHRAREYENVLQQEKFDLNLFQLRIIKLI